MCILEEKYDKTAERLWEKLEFCRKEIDLDIYYVVDKTYPYEGMVKTYPKFKELVKEVEKEFNYRMEFFPKNWVIVRFLAGDMEKFNRLHNKNLSARR